ncbi:MAG: CTP synthase [Helicobacteraceae bacterium]|jgi:CTP synthase|nr:CTP synthase [Helicobacteraceae bacterium]
MTNYIVVTGGVLSSLGKGVTSASVAALLRNANQNVSMLKIDPYINVDPGTMSPLEHGEVFVTADGGETDLDLGHYERFIDATLSKRNNFTTGQVYQTVIEKERRGDYLGKTIQVVPHITDEIIRRIKIAGKEADTLVVELGGTVGDIEGLPFYEAIRQLKHRLKSKVFNIHVTLLPYLAVADELKTKPTQHSVQELRRIGLSPDMLVLRSEKSIPKEMKRKLSEACDVEADCVIEAIDAKSVYEMPLKFYEDGLLKPIAKAFELGDLKPNLREWKRLVKNILEPSREVTIAFVGKYLELKESYKSLIEALIHAGAHNDAKILLKWIDSEALESADAQEAQNALKSADAVLVPGGFGSRGVEGKIRAIRFARENGKVFLGICLGLQLAMIEFARNVLRIEGAASQEFDRETKEPIIYLIDEFIDQSGDKQIRTRQSPMGGTMRLGEYECNLKAGTKLAKAYDGAEKIHERHRHRYEANGKYREAFENAGMIVSGEARGLIEAIELRDHPWFVAVQFHPEFTSRLQNPNRAILAFVENALKHKAPRCSL